MLKKILFIIPFVVLIVGLLLFYRSTFLNATNQTFKVTNASCVDEDSLRSLLNLSSQKLILVNQNQIESKIKKGFICVQSVSVKKSFPNRVEVDVSGRVPIALLDFVPTPLTANLPDLSLDQIEATPSSQSAVVIKDPQADINQASGSAKLLVDKEGIIYGQGADGGTLPEFLFSGDKLDVGEKIDVSLIDKSLQIISRLKTLSVNPAGEPLIYNDILRLDSSNYGRLYFSLSKDLNRELASLQLILVKVTMNSGSDLAGVKSRQVESIDLRFDKPVVVYTANK